MKTPKDWEIIAQKKDVEEIKKLLVSNLIKKDSLFKKSILSVLLTVVSTLISTFFTTAFSSKGTTIPYWVYLAVGCFILILAIIPFTKDIIFLFNRTPTINTETIISSVDLFDNDIIYNTMMANKYCEMTLDQKNSPQETNFYKTETCYLCKKVLHQLSSIEQRAVSYEIESCGFGSNKRIFSERILAVLDFIDFIETQLQDDIFSKQIDSQKNNLRNKFFPKID